MKDHLSLNRHPISLGHTAGGYVFCPNERYHLSNAQLLKGSDPYIMHDMPIHRGYEISAEAIENPKSVIYEQAENRLYAAKAIYLNLIGV